MYLESDAALSQVNFADGACFEGAEFRGEPRFERAQVGAREPGRRPLASRVTCMGDHVLAQQAPLALSATPSASWLNPAIEISLPVDVGKRRLDAEGGAATLPPR